MTTSNIDDLLMGSLNSNPVQPQMPADKPLMQQNEASLELEASPYEDVLSNAKISTPEKAQEKSDTPEDDVEIDEYGIEKPQPRMYTEEEKNEAIQKAIKRRFKEREESQPYQPQIQQPQKQPSDSLDYDPNANAPWEQQFEQMVEQSVKKMNHREIQLRQQQQEMQAHQELSEKFQRGMNRFSDFEDVVSGQPITDSMTVALRAIDDPAAFIYAASKLHSNELDRISKLSPVVQIAEIARLEERMRKKPLTSNAPAPVSRTKEDSAFKEKAKKKAGDSIDDLLVQSHNEKMAQLRARRGR